MPDDYAGRLASGSTTFCRCFRVERRDGVVLGFTDHDEDVTLEGLVCRASAAMAASEAAAGLGMAPDELDAAGALADETLTESDLAAGRYDGARVTLFDVDWTDPATFAILGAFTIGQVERGPLAFRAELRSLAAGLDRRQGRVHASTCDVAVLGDERCRANLDGWRGVGTVVELASPSDLVVEGLGGFAPGTFDGGRLTWTVGPPHPNAGQSVDVRLSRGSGTRTRVSLWREPFAAPAPGDGFEIVTGCDRTVGTCRGKFDNLINFRGFPHMPGQGYAAEYAQTGDPNLDGGSRFD
jgi:uncharacterized phage protein (TIGR02218 family)